MTFRSDDEALTELARNEEFLDALEHTARLPVLKRRRHAIQPRRHKHGRRARPGAALPLTGQGLAEWHAWINGEETFYPCRRAVV
jgi:hypothetical protein